jgi:hypothetical protein
MRKQTLEFSKRNKLLMICGVIWGIALFSILVRPFGYETTLTTWVDNWGTKTGWIIRVCMFILGLIGVIIGMKRHIKGMAKADTLPDSNL